MTDKGNTPGYSAGAGGTENKPIENMSRDELAAEVQQLRSEILRHSRIETLKTALSRTIYHDLKSPINTIISLLDVVLEEAFGPLNEKQKDFIRRAENSLYRMVSLVEKCLDLAKIEGEIFNQKLDDLLVEEFLAPIVKNLSQRAEKKNITLSLEIEKGMPSATADERGFRHVFQNLVNNAVKYTPEGGKITVSASRDGEFLLVRVADSGVGIEEKDIENIFKPFFRCSGAEKMDSKGTGLGLAITKMILDACGGEISVESEPGKGSTFIVRYPFSGTASAE